ncbi:hypothetical protein HDU87_001107 [Geranomyces variabilis]|uniref:Uncharacterized protein n=1 Tax=Geranomyces variabilis TaxID=109894 RepID=A0AAD5TNR3_9FUNG|nr:hypothetical protein HDU87_001107 [Geranomyces variabilis]
MSSASPTTSQPRLPAVAALNAHPSGVVLASGSPRRKEILTNIVSFCLALGQSVLHVKNSQPPPQGLEFSITPSTFPETLDKSAHTPQSYVRATATAKALEVHSRLAKAATPTSPSAPPPIVISADTVISHAGRILEKPRDVAHAVDMLRGLSGREHEVLTAVVVLYGVDKETTSIPLYESMVKETKVVFSELDDETIQAYVATGEPMDKAGGYGYQGLAACFVSRIEGCYYNVVGFPVNAFLTLVGQLQRDGRIKR